MPHTGLENVPPFFATQNERTYLAISTHISYNLYQTAATSVVKSSIYTRARPSREAAKALRAEPIALFEDGVYKSSNMFQISTSQVSTQFRICPKGELGSMFFRFPSPCPNRIWGTAPLCRTDTASPTTCSLPTSYSVSPPSSQSTALTPGTNNAVRMKSMVKLLTCFV